MSRFGKAISSTPVNVALFVIAAILLLGSIVGGTQAALSYYSDTYLARLWASSIGVTLYEGETPVAWRNYDGNGEWNEQTLEDPATEERARLLSGLSNIEVGHEYDEALSVENTGRISEYVRVSVSKYWEDKDGNKITHLYKKDENGKDVEQWAADFINITPANEGVWIADDETATPETTTYYYTKLLTPGERTPALTKSVSVDSAIGSMVTQSTETKDGVTTVTTKYDYDGMRFCLEATAYGVQEHNILDAIRSAWGKFLTLNSDGTLSLSGNRG